MHIKAILPPTLLILTLLPLPGCLPATKPPTGWTKEAVTQRAAGPSHSSEPVAWSMPPPEYPEAALNAGIGGTVILRLSIDAKGNVSSSRLEQSSGNHDLDQSAIATTRQWRFSPSIENGKPVPSQIRVPVRFVPNLDQH